MWLIKIITLSLLALGVATEKTLEERDSAVWATSDYSGDTSIRSFEITFSDEDILDLRNRIDDTRAVVAPLEGVGFNYGFNTDYLRNWSQFWAYEYDFNTRLVYMNQHSQYKTNIQGLDIHFAHVVPEVSDCVVVPLLMIHGFPGSMFDFWNVIPLLTSTCTNGIVFEVIVPSLPGFGFSDATYIIGLGTAEVSTILVNLMKRLGHEQFYVHGQDWTQIGSMMSTIYIDNVLGYHTTHAVSYNPLSLGILFAGQYVESLIVTDDLKDRLLPVTSYLRQIMTETGYLHILATKPDTIGVALSDSPAGLMSYCLQSYLWGNSKSYVNDTDGGLDGIYAGYRDAVMDEISLYWFTNSMTTASRLLAETFNRRTFDEGTYANQTKVPVYTVHTKNEYIYMSPIMLKIKYANLLHCEVHDDYGHWLSVMQPDIFTASVFNATRAFRTFHGIA